MSFFIDWSLNRAGRRIILAASHAEMVVYLSVAVFGTCMVLLYVSEPGTLTDSTILTRDMVKIAAFVSGAIFASFLVVWKWLLHISADKDGRIRSIYYKRVPSYEELDKVISEKLPAPAPREQSDESIFGPEPDGAWWRRCPSCPSCGRYNATQRMCLSCESRDTYSREGS
jgi:hypothetical protein